MPRYKLSPEERAAEQERKENLRNIMKGLDVKNFDDLKTGILKRPLKQALAKRKSKCRETETVNLSRSL